MTDHAVTADAAAGAAAGAAADAAADAEGAAGADAAASVVAPPSSGRRDHWELFATVVLSLATLASAWSGYQASRWSSHASSEWQKATAAHFTAERAAATADRQRSVDVSVFTTWFEAAALANDAKAEAVATRFRPEFLPAFLAWSATAEGAALPAGTPFDRPEYALAADADVERATARAEVHTTDSLRFKQQSDSYVLLAVLYASVLFFAGIASKMSTTRSSHTAVVLAGAVFVAATSLMLSFPMSVGTW